MRTPTFSRALGRAMAPPHRWPGIFAPGPAVDGVPAKTALSPSRCGPGSREHTGSGPSCNEFAMTLPLMPARAGRQGGRRFAGSALLVLLAVSVMSGPGRAQDADAFSATVAVDATADSAAQAREMARTDGQRRALAAVAERTRAKLPKLDDKASTDLVLSFE